MAMIAADQVTGHDLVVDGGLNVKYPVGQERNRQ